MLRFFENFLLKITFYQQLGHVAEAIQECTEVLKYVDENDWEVLLNRGEAYLLNEDYDSGLEFFLKKFIKKNFSGRRLPKSC